MDWRKGAIVFQCPACGSNVADEVDAEILTCPRCGTTLSKEFTEYDKSLKYLREKDAREEQRRKEQTAWQRKEQKVAAIVMITFIVLGIVYLYLRQKGIL